MIFRSKIHQHSSSNLRMSENAHRKRGRQGVNLLNKFLPRCEPPLSYRLFACSPAYGAPALGRPVPLWNLGSRRAPRNLKSGRERGATLGTILGGEELLYVQGESSGQGESAGGGDAEPRAGGPLAAAVAEDLLESAAEPESRRAAAELEARRGVSGLQAGSSFQGPGKEGGMFAPREGGRGGERSKETPKIEQREETEENTKALRGARARRLQSMLLKVVALARAGGSGARGWKLAVPPYR